MDEGYNRDWLNEEEAEAFIGKNASFYLDKWNSHSDSSLKGWNWAAMFFSIEWMVYRKMYAEAILYFFIISTLAVLLGLLLSVFSINLNGTILRDTFRIIMGIWGNAIYRKKALRVLRKNVVLNDADRLFALKNKGGVSVASVIICSVIEIGIGFLLAAL